MIVLLDTMGEADYLAACRIMGRRHARVACACPSASRPPPPSEATLTATALIDPLLILCSSSSSRALSDCV